jgi:SAM-dependent methyltransferase
MKFAAYDQIAGEYYDAFHKTCRNFDQTTIKALESVRSRIPQGGLILDIGSGKGRCVEFLGVDANQVIQLDNSRAILDLSPREAFLCDPYLGLDFLAEAYRILRTDGLFLATTPAYEWGTALRRGISIDSSEMRFETLAGSEVRVPSILVPRDRLVEMLRRVGFISEIQVQPHRLPKDAAPVSEDVTRAADALKCRVHELDLLYLVIARK